MKKEKTGYEAACGTKKDRDEHARSLAREARLAGATVLITLLPNEDKLASVAIGYRGYRCLVDFKAGRNLTTFVAAWRTLPFEWIEPFPPGFAEASGARINRHDTHHAIMMSRDFDQLVGMIVAGLTFLVKSKVPNPFAAPVKLPRVEGLLL